METIAKYQRKAFLKDHPPVLARALLGSTGSEQTLLAGTVLGIKEDGKQYAYSGDGDDMEARSILAEDVTIPASGDKYALTYVHCDAVAAELIWDDSVSAAGQYDALDELHSNGIYAAEA
ncbi:MAG: head decoration protein [Desulfobulbaceae bacterium]|jgi:hypothetical protein|nr:head decoration protein [Desulfobulbaceae bacterium]